MRFYPKKRNGIITLLVLTASLTILTETAAVGALLHRAAAFLAGAREYRYASALADQTIWRLEQGELAETGDETVGGLQLTWRCDLGDSPDERRIQVLVSGRLMGRDWSTAWISYQ